MTDSIFKTWETSRKLYASFFDNYSLEQLNKIPPGFGNNLIWNLGHVLVAQQSIIYRLSSLEMYVTDEMFDLYKPGSRPARDATEEAVDEIKSLLHSLVATTKADFDTGKFVSFNERTTATGFQLSSLSDAFEFNNYHEALHLGVMMSLRKFV